MKSINVVIGMPSPDLVPASFALQNLPGIISYTKKHRPDITLNVMYKTGVRTDRNRNDILAQCLDAGNIDYILWLDVDMLYPLEIICTYLQAEFDIMGCLYFKRSEPYDPVAFLKSDKPFSYHAIDIMKLGKEVVELDALGYGGLMVNMRVYHAMGEDKWTVYGEQYHTPVAGGNHLTHDLNFCRLAQNYGFKILMHPGVRPGHLSEIVANEDAYLKATGRDKQPGQDGPEESQITLLPTPGVGKVVGYEPESTLLSEKFAHLKIGEELKKITPEYVDPTAMSFEITPPKIVVIMPTIHPELAAKTKDILLSRAGIDCDIIVAHDQEKRGYAKICNLIVGAYPADLYCYVSDDIFPSRNWLKDAVDLMFEKKVGLVGFNDGKWKGKLATVGLVDANWMKTIYDGRMFFPEYFGHYNDTELTMIAMAQGQYAYDPNICLTEVDYEKDKKGVNPADRELYRQRKLTGFDGKVTDPKIVEMFA